MPKKETTKELVKFDIETAVIVALDTKYKDIQITDGKSYALVMAGIAAYRDLRLSVVDGHKKEKKDALEHCNFLDSEKRRILARLAPGEDKLKAIRQAWDDEKERIREEKARIEQERIKQIQSKISLICVTAHGYQTMDLAKLRAISNKLEAMDPTKEEFAELTEEATKVLDDTYNTIQDAITTRIKLDKEDADRKAEDARLEKIRLDQEAAQKLLDEAAARHQAKIDEAQKKIDDERAKLEADKKAEDDRKAKEAFEKAATEKAQAAAAQKVIDDAKEKEEKEKAEEAEKTEKAARAPDKEKLIKWVASFNETNNPTPQLKSKEAKEIYRIAFDQIVIILQDAEDKAEKL